MDEIDYEACVAAGAAWLDEHRPDWVRVFADGVLNGIEMENCKACVLGHVYGNYWASDLFADLVRVDSYGRYGGCAGGSIEDLDQAFDQATHLGFNIRAGDGFLGYLALGKVWRDLIGKRLADQGLLG